MLALPTTTKATHPLDSNGYSLELGMVDMNLESDFAATIMQQTALQFDNHDQLNQWTLAAWVWSLAAWLGG